MGNYRVLMRWQGDIPAESCGRCGGEVRPTTDGDVSVSVRLTTADFEGARLVDENGVCWEVTDMLCPDCGDAMDRDSRELDAWSQGA